MSLTTSIIQMKIKEVEEAIEKEKINIINYEYYNLLLTIHQKLWDLAYFKLHQEKGYLDKAEDD